MSLEHGFASMAHGEVQNVSHPSVGDFRVEYEAEQAMGDNNLPARGYTVGHYHVTEPSGKVVSFRHSPHGPTLTGAKPYAARQAAEHISGKINEATRSDLFHDRRGD
jgi:hypothetical protein